MKKIVLCLLTLFALSFNLGAQDRTAPKDPKQRATEQTARLKEELKLSDAQLQKIQELRLKTIEQSQPIRMEAKAIKEKSKEIARKREEQINAILSEEQRRQIAEIRNSSKESQKALKTEKMAIKQRLIEIRKEEKEQMKSILSEKQYKKYMERKHAKHKKHRAKKFEWQH